MVALRSVAHDKWSIYLLTPGGQWEQVIEPTSFHRALTILGWTLNRR